ncbi:MAG: hypothetical protein ACRD2W_02720 [Acidimicrobiales bacterium]
MALAIATAASTSAGGLPCSSQHEGFSRSSAGISMPSRAEELVVHVEGGVAVRRDEDDDDALALGPDGEQAIAAVEVPAAQVLQLLAGEAIAPASQPWF